MKIGEARPEVWMPVYPHPMTGTAYWNGQGTEPVNIRFEWNPGCENPELEAIIVNGIKSQWVMMVRPLKRALSKERGISEKRYHQLKKNNR